MKYLVRGVSSVGTKIRFLVEKLGCNCKLFVEAVHIRNEEMFFMFPMMDLSLGLAKEFISRKSNKVSYAVRAGVKMALLKLHALNLTKSSFPAIGKL
jgi:hypothetical protein